MKPARFAPLAPDRAAYLLNQVERFEPDWLLPLPYVDHGHRAAWLSVLAFGAEVIGVPGRVSNGMLGRIRLQWWREALGEVFGPGPVRQHPVVETLAELLEHEADLRLALERVIDGMEVFLAHGQDHNIAKALSERSAYTGLADALSLVSGSPSGGEGLALHALCRVAPDRDVVPAEDGTETPARRFSRFLAMHPAAEEGLAQRLSAYRQQQQGALPLAALPLRLFDVRDQHVVRLRHPFGQKAALFTAVLRGRI